MRACVAIIVLVACKQADAPKAVPPTAPAPVAAADQGAANAEGSAKAEAAATIERADDAEGCEQLPFAESTPVPEASGAAWLTIDGKLSLVVLSDSGHGGAYGIIDPETGATGEQGKIPLDASQDTEGLAARDGKLYAVTSAGWMLAWERKGAGFKLVDGPYALGPIDGADVCKMKRFNCGRNFEGLALAPRAPASGCAGFACSKKDGRLYCLVEQGGRFVADFKRFITVSKPDALGDCGFSPDGTLWVGDNFFGLSQVYRVDGWADPATAKVVPGEQLGVGFPEVIAARGDVIYRMSDTGGAPSLMAKFRCKPIVP